MGLLQDPVTSLEQAQWYLDNKGLEKFPGAFELAAGNLCRQTLEQILLILCFFSTMPTNKYFKTDRTLRVAGHLYEQLRKIKPTTNKSFFEIARNRGSRIRKFATNPRTLNKWRGILNESSHFSAKFRKIDENVLSEFINYANTLFDSKDKYLIVSALNEVFSGGKIKAVLGKDIENTPGIMIQSVVGVKNLERTPEGGISLTGCEHKFHVLSSTEIPRGRWPQTAVLVQHSAGILFRMQFIKRDRSPINISSTKALINSFSTTAEEQKRLIRRLKKIGFEVVIDEAQQ